MGREQEAISLAVAFVLNCQGDYRAPPKDFCMEGTSIRTDYVTFFVTSPIDSLQVIDGPLAQW